MPKPTKEEAEMILDQVFAPLDGSVVESSALLDAARTASDLLVSECINKHQIDPTTDDHLYPDDWHLEITVTFGEVKALAAAVSEASNDKITGGSRH